MDTNHLQAQLNAGYLHSLQSYPSWVVWRLLTDKQGEMKKVPFTPRTYRSASSANPQSWDTLPTALKALKTGTFAGLGFVFSETTPFTGIDFDNCLVDGRMNPAIEDLVKLLDSYTEYSPSRRGLHVIVRGKLPGRNIKRPGIELYDRLRFFTITLDHFPGTPLDARETAGLVQLYQHLMPPKHPPVVFSQPEQMASRFSDEQVLAKAMNNPKMGTLFRRHFLADPTLWSGPQAIHHSRSEAVWRLVLYLKYFTYGNAEQMDRLFRQSSLYTISKWDELRGEDTYGQLTIKKALENP